jgi:alpha-beta hydrolase superfamily lysophospholipase
VLSIKSLNVIISIAFSMLVMHNAYAITPSPNTGPAAEYANGGGQSTTQERLGSSCTLYSPVSLTGNHPVIVWGNGTGTTTSSYAQLLRHWASWGFVVVAANTSSAGSGSAMISCLDSAYSSLGNQLSDQVATTGHSQGGGGAVMAGTDSRVDATAPIQPNATGLGVTSSSHSRQNGPMLLLSGSADTVVPPNLQQQPIYNNANVPVFWATRSGASHFEPTNNGGDFRGITTAWFLYKLKGDTEAATLFEGSNCGFCNASGWDVQRKGF